MKVLPAMAPDHKLRGMVLFRVSEAPDGAMIVDHCTDWSAETGVLVDFLDKEEVDKITEVRREAGALIAQFFRLMMHPEEIGEIEMKRKT